MSYFERTGPFDPKPRPRVPDDAQFEPVDEDEEPDDDGATLDLDGSGGVDEEPETVSERDEDDPYPDRVMVDAEGKRKEKNG